MTPSTQNNDTKNINHKNNNHNNNTQNINDTKNINDKNNNNNTENINDMNNNHYNTTYSTPYVTAPSTFLSPPRHQPSRCFFYSAPTSPIHLSSSAAVKSPANSDDSFEFDSRVDSPKLGTADELFLNGQIRLQNNSINNNNYNNNNNNENEIEIENENQNQNDVVFTRLRHRRTRSMSPLRNTTPFHWLPPQNSQVAAAHGGDRAVDTAAGRNSKRWLFLKDFIRSKSEGRGNSKFWHNISATFSKEKRGKKGTVQETVREKVEKRRSAHEIHYAARRAEMEELKKRTYLPYRQGLFGGCLGFNPKSFGALNDFATSLATR